MFHSIGRARSKGDGDGGAGRKDQIMGLTGMEEVGAGDLG